MLKSALQRLMQKEFLNREEAFKIMTSILNGEATPSQISSLITILSFRGIETEELIGLTLAMRTYSTTLDIDSSIPLVDTCGTGGSKAKTFNVSTVSAIVASSSGLYVAKHGNRAATSLTGSADVLQELGIPVELTPEEIKQRLINYHMCFMFAPIYHQAMRHAASTRKEIGFRSVFNLLGPLTNPAQAKRQVIGVYDHQYAIKMVEALRELGSEHVLVVTGKDGLDEFTLSTSTLVTELKNGAITEYELNPEEVGLTYRSLEGIQVKTPQESAQIIRYILQGLNKSAAYDIVAYNTGAALYVGGKVTSIKEGVKLAKELIDSGKAYEHYNKMTNLEGAVRHA